MSAENTPTTTKLSHTTVIGALIAHFFWEQELKSGQDLSEWLEKVGPMLPPGGLESLLGPSGDAACKLLIDMCLEKTILGEVSGETTTEAKKLPEDEQLFLSTTYLSAIGQSPSGGEKGRWCPPLWKIKKGWQRFNANSPIKIPKASVCNTIKAVAWEAVSGIRKKAMSMLE